MEDYTPNKPHTEVTEWDPVQILQNGSHQNALLVLNQPVKDSRLLDLLWENSVFRIAADGGANHLLNYFQTRQAKDNQEKLKLDAICGDLDSLTPDVRKYFKDRGTSILEDTDQCSTDFTKCIRYLRDIVFPSIPHPSPDIVCLGGLGGRVDQGMSQLHHLLMFQETGYNARKVYLLSTEAITFVLRKGKHRVRVRPDGWKEKGLTSELGKHIGILPLKGPSRITTQGLEWDVEDWLTQFGGQVSTSNHVKEAVVNIFTTEDVLFTIDFKLENQR